MPRRSSNPGAVESGPGHSAAPEADDPGAKAKPGCDGRHQAFDTLDAEPEPNRAQAYYHLALAAIYEDDAISEGRPDDITRAIEEYKLALNADPNSPELKNALADLYFRTPGHGTMPKSPRARC